ncbi:MAG: sodium/sugar symporter [Bacteroidales bacterium]|nr:sodium/sugar symporter [Bacteroidales bacterium]
MNNEGFSILDYAVFIGYGLLIVFVGLWVSRKKKGEKKTAKDYFLASKSLPWWAIGASLIAANISAEQFIGMSGSGYAIGLAIASYEWMAAATLILVGKFLLPIFLEKKIFTMPQFLEIRYDSRVRTALAIFWLFVYVFVNLTSVLYLGALALKTIMGVPMIYGIIGLALFAAIYSIYGGLTAVAWTDVVQVIFLVGGGLLTTYLALDAVSGGQGFIAGFSELIEKAPEKFDMILEKGQLMIPDGRGGLKDAYLDLPGISVLIGGMWIANLSYWGFNQYIIQRGLAAKNIREAQRGVIFAGYLKILMPLIVVIPGIVAFVLNADLIDPETGMIVNDKAYPWLLHKFIPTGIKGLAFAALAAAIVSSLASMINSTSTIFTMDIYKRFIYKKVSDTQMVTVGRITSLIALIIAVLAAKPLLGNLDQAFQYIQEFTGMVTPGVLVIFGFGMFWKRATANAALWVAILTIPMAWAFKLLLPGFPFLDRMGVIFLLLSAVLIIFSLLESKTDDPKGITLPKGFFKTGTPFNIGALGICIILAFLYIWFW